MKIARFLLLASSLTLLSTFGCSERSPGSDSGIPPEASPKTELIGKPAPDFTLPTLEGSKLSLADYRGKTVILDFWATWCAPCLKTLPVLEELESEFQDRGLVLLSIDQGESAEDVEEFVTKRGLNIKVVLDTEMTLASPFEVNYLPHTVIVDSSGVVRAVKAGAWPNMKESLAALLEELLASTP